MTGATSLSGIWEYQQEARNLEANVIAFQRMLGSTRYGSNGESMNDYLPSITSAAQGKENAYGGVWGWLKTSVDGKELLTGIDRQVDNEVQNIANNIDGQQAVMGTEQDNDGYEREAIAIVPRGRVNLGEQLKLGSENANKANPDAIGVHR